MIHQEITFHYVVNKGLLVNKHKAACWPSPEHIEHSRLSLFLFLSMVSKPNCPQVGFIALEEQNHALLPRRFPPDGQRLLLVWGRDRVEKYDSRPPTLHRSGPRLSS